MGREFVGGFLQQDLVFFLRVLKGFLVKKPKYLIDKSIIERYTESITIDSTTFDRGAFCNISYNEGRMIMSKPDTSIDPRILEAARKEFLSLGYEKASTNVICKNAGVTWGALAKRYSGKDALFCALVSPVADSFKAALMGQQEHFHGLPEQEKEETALDSKVDITDFVDYIYDHFEEFRLLLICSKGSSYENYLEELVHIVVESITRFMEETGHEAVIQGKKATAETIHILVSANLYGYFEPVKHGMTREEARIYVEQLKYFFDVGWADILRLKK